ncbi:MAG: hypothetical protein WC010_00180 [Candidatus Absconditabacterales bacterium]
MENFNAKLSSESVRNVNTLIQKIEGVCKDIEKSLFMSLDLNSDSVAQYSVTTANKVESEFVNVVVDNITKIKLHLGDLKKALSQKVISNTDAVTKIVGSLQETSDTLQTFLLSNNFFNTTFQMPVMEIQAAIDQIFEEVSMVEYAHAA